MSSSSRFAARARRLWACGLARHARLIVTILLAHAGWRSRRGGLVRLVALAASLALWAWIESRHDVGASCAAFAVMWLCYYLGLSLALGTRLRLAASQRYGEEAAFLRYEVVIGVLFLNQGLAVGAVSSLGGAAWTLPLAEEWALLSGGALAAFGLTIKVWATALVGLDTYYFKDLFVGRALGALVRGGPYRVFAHPMYGVGNLHGYGVAIMLRSSSGLVAAALCHLGIYAFYVLVEAPFLRRTYGAPGSPVATALPLAMQPTGSENP